MVIKSVEDLRGLGRHIDLTGPEGNAYSLLGLARDLASQMEKDPEDVCNRMKSGDYENLIKVFDEEFGDFITLYR